MSVADPAAGRPGLPQRRVTVNQLVAYNMAFFRKAAGLGQQEFGEPLGWSAASVSAAERSWESKRIKKFDADEIAQIAAALGVPLAALFMPPEDHGTAVRYVLRLPGSGIKDLDDLLPLVLPGAGADSAAMDAYRKRILAAGASGRVEDNLETAKKVLELAQRAADEAIEMALSEADQTREGRAVRPMRSSSRPGARRSRSSASHGPGQRSWNKMPRSGTARRLVRWRRPARNSSAGSMTCARSSASTGRGSRHGWKARSGTCWQAIRTTRSMR